MSLNNPNTNSTLVSELEQSQGWVLEESAGGEMSFTNVPYGFDGFVGEHTPAKIFNAKFDNPDPGAGGNITLLLERVDGRLISARICRPALSDAQANSRVILSEHEDTAKNREMLLTQHNHEIFRNTGFPHKVALLPKEVPRGNAFAAAKARAAEKGEFAQRLFRAKDHQQYAPSPGM